MLEAITPSGTYGSYVSVGKKPGSTNPADAFNGLINYAYVKVG